MAAAPQNMGLDAPVTLKVFYDGATRRAKMPLREMAPKVLEKHIRSFLHISDDAAIMIERYSDSAAAYVMLDSANMSVYKQLYRAAKAKSKLKLRVTVLGKDDKEEPKPAVEDEPEALLEPVKTEPAVKTEEPAVEDEPGGIKAETRDPAAAVPPVPSPLTLPLRGSAHYASQTGPLFTDPAKFYDSKEWNKQFQSRMNDIKRTTDDLAGLTSHWERQLWVPTPFEPSTKHANKSPAPVKVSNNLASSCPATGCSFAVCCNSCEKTIPDAHYHCSTCDDGDFDLCQSCIDLGITCYSNDHWLIKRTMKNGQIVNSTTETFPAKPKPKPKVAKEDPKPKVAKEEPKPKVTKEEPKPKVTKEEPKPKVAKGEPKPKVTKGEPKPKVTKGGPKPKVTKEEPKPRATEDYESKPMELDEIMRNVNRNTTFDLFAPPPISRAALDPIGALWSPLVNMRTCNCCVQEFPEREFLHCSTCEDYDLCQLCFANDAHGHHPKHGFIPAVAGTQMPDHIKVKMDPGRNQLHHAICDGCDKIITGVRHKCLDCPDWDYCSDCVTGAEFVHSHHRFAPIYEPLAHVQTSTPRQIIHVGICCDGPLCSISQGYPSYIRGVRYKCAVCHDLDFCANCEASPANNHNETHPLIKFKTPVRHVNVTTTGEHHDGKRMPVMGDRNNTASKATETASPCETVSVNTVQDAVDVKPVQCPPAPPAAPALEPEVKQDITAAPETPKMLTEQDLRAVFVRDSVDDGTILPPNHVFEQTWVLRNEGSVPWPAGCSVKYVGGDYMGHVDSAHPAGISELVSASESTVCYAPLAPGQECSFTVLLRTPPRPGKIVSYWRLTTPDGLKFGHRLWCDVNVRSMAAEPKSDVSLVPIEEDKKGRAESSGSSSTMIFPKLDKESPSASIHEEVRAEMETEATGEKLDVEDEFEDCGDEAWDASEDGFMTDEEYDILDASDEEFLEEQLKSLKK